MKTISKIKYVFFLIVIAGFFACKGETGPAGPAGKDGKDGIDGVDGNANVQLLTYDISTSTGVRLTISVPEITQSVFDNDLILAYVIRGAYQYPVPAIEVAELFDIRAIYQVGFYILEFYNSADGTLYTLPEGQLNTLKLVIIEPEAGTKSLNPQQEILYNLDKAGVDINNYYQVTDYYGLDY